jgi:hypothetical protein
VPWLRRLVAGLSPRRPGFDPGSVHVGFVVDKVALEQAFPRVLRFSPLNFIPPVFHYSEKRKKKLIIFITGLHNKPQGCGASVASAAGPCTTKKNLRKEQYVIKPTKPGSNLNYLKRSLLRENTQPDYKDLPVNAAKISKSTLLFNIIRNA